MPDGANLATDLVVDLGLKLNTRLDDVDRGKATMRDATADGTGNGETSVQVNTCWGRLRLQSVDLFGDGRNGELGEEGALVGAGWCRHCRSRC